MQNTKYKIRNKILRIKNLRCKLLFIFIAYITKQIAGLASKMVGCQLQLGNIIFILYTLEH